tara:strand:+ start:1864 stop:2325 length:462 start_codon:yes stop_codon:yes gene_type:complete
MKIQFEKRVCSRCSGEGSFLNYSHIHSGKCFKCHGAGKILTKNGRTAFDSYVASMTIPASELEKGMGVYLVELNPFTGGTREFKARIYSIEWNEKHESFEIEFANMAWTTLIDAKFIGKAFNPSEKFRMIMTADNSHLAVEALEGLKGATITE